MKSPSPARLVVVGLVVALVGAGVWLERAPPDLIRVGAGYTAKIVCSGVFVAGRDPDQVLALDVQAAGHPLLRLMRVSVDREARVVRAGLFGFAGGGLAVARDGTGCATVPDGDLARAMSHATTPAPRVAPGEGRWPAGDDPGTSDPALRYLLGEPALAGPDMRAMLVVYRGRIIAERYGEGFDAATPLLGWSMTKTVTAALVGTLVRDKRLATDRKALFDAWAGDGRREITIADLLAMSSGLVFNEDDGSVSDVTRMLYLEPDMAAFAAARPLAHAPGSHFSYSSGTTVMLARQWQDAEGPAALAWPREALFDPLGMHSAVMEADESGTFVGSSYLYATGRDWARFALLLLQDGRWNGKPLLPPGWVKAMRAPSRAAPTEYTQAQMWLHGPRGRTPPGENPDAAYTLPADTVWMLGHDGQSIAIVPSRDLAVVRLGLTPSKLSYQPQRLLKEVLHSLP